MLDESGHLNGRKVRVVWFQLFGVVLYDGGWAL